MDKTRYIELLSEASIDKTTKFTVRSKERPKTKGRPPKYYHPLLEIEKQLLPKAKFARCNRQSTTSLWVKIGSFIRSAKDS